MATSFAELYPNLAYWVESFGWMAMGKMITVRHSSGVSEIFGGQGGPPNPPWFAQIS